MISLIDEQYQVVRNISKDIIIRTAETGQTIFLPINNISSINTTSYAVKIGIGGKEFWHREYQHKGTIGVEIYGQSEMIAGSWAALRMIVRDGKSGISDAAVTFRLLDEKTGYNETLLTTYTNLFGTLEAGFNIPEDAPENGIIKIEVISNKGETVVEKTIHIRRNIQILLTADKPTYQPSQIIHIRALALKPANLKPASNEKITLEVADAKGK